MKYAPFTEQIFTNNLYYNFETVYLNVDRFSWKATERYIYNFIHCFIVVN